MRYYSIIWYNCKQVFKKLMDKLWGEWGVLLHDAGIYKR